MLKAIFIMMMMNISCKGILDERLNAPAINKDSVIHVSTVKNDTIIKAKQDIVIKKSSLPSLQIEAKNIPVDSIIDFAKTLIGTPYKYASVDPAQGFDCSGFITYVYNHFNIKVPRSSVDFTNFGKEIAVRDSQKGDLILFTGTDSTTRVVGHMGIIVSADISNIQFIHSTSGKAYGVVITPLNDYYKTRFVKVVRLPESF